MNGKRRNLQVADSQLEWTPKHLDVVAVVFVTALLISNLAAQKLFQFGPAAFTAGILVFPINYIFADVLTEVYGFNRARRVIYMGLLANLFMALVLWIAIKLPPAHGWNLQPEFQAIHTLVPRIVLGSVIAYVVGELANSFVMSRLKVRTSARHLWIRTISSTIVGQFLDTCIFALIAFAGVLPNTLIVRAILSAWLFKVAYESAATPFTYLIVNRLKAAEGIEHFDRKDRLGLLRTSSKGSKHSD